MTAFEFNGATITLGSPTGKSRMRLNFLLNIARDIEKENEYMGYAAQECAYLLYSVESVKGDVGFCIPFEAPTRESFLRFIEDLQSVDESFYIQFVRALNERSRALQKDPDLLPPDELTDDQKKASMSKKND